jgi:chemotaxis protein methyltransferase CheR
MLNDAEFALVAREVKARSGAVLTRDMAGAMVMKLTPLARRENYASVHELIAAARIKAEGALFNAITEYLANSETRFFRDKAQFEQIRTTLLPDALARRGHERVRIWSAACATGQEPYSIAMIVEEMREQGLNPAVEIFASDASERLLDKARAGLYTQFEVQRGLPIRKLIAHFEKAGDLWRISDRLRAGVKFEKHNLLKHPGEHGRFDIIVLSHVLGAFDAETRISVLARVADVLAPGGAIVLGAGETCPEVEGLVCDGGVLRHASEKRAAA